MNLYEMILEKIGVKENEKFNIIMTNGESSFYSKYNPYHFENGFLVDGAENFDEGVFVELLTGRVTIEKLPKTIYDLKDNDLYYFISSGSSVTSDRWTNNDTDNKRLSTGNVYLTKEKVEFEIERRKVVAEMKRLGGTKDLMSLGDMTTDKYFLIYDHNDKTLAIASCSCIPMFDTLYFKDKRTLQRAIDIIGEKRIIKYFFNAEVEED